MLLLQPIERQEQQVKVFIKNLANVQASSFFRYNFKFSCWNIYFPQKQKEQRHKQLGYTDKLIMLLGLELTTAEIGGSNLGGDDDERISSLLKMVYFKIII